MKNFLMFDFMISPWIIRILYFLAQLYILFLVFFAIVDPEEFSMAPIFTRSLLTNFIILIILSLATRLFFELLMVQFKIAENTSQLKEGNKA